MEKEVVFLNEYNAGIESIKLLHVEIRNFNHSLLSVTVNLDLLDPRIESSGTPRNR